MPTSVELEIGAAMIGASLARRGAAGDERPTSATSAVEHEADQADVDERHDDVGEAASCSTRPR